MPGKEYSVPQDQNLRFSHSLERSTKGKRLRFCRRVLRHQALQFFPSSGRQCVTGARSSSFALHDFAWFLSHIHKTRTFQLIQSRVHNMNFQSGHRNDLLHVFMAIGNSLKHFNVAQRALVRCPQTGILLHSSAKHFSSNMCYFVIARARLLAGFRVQSPCHGCKASALEFSQCTLYAVPPQFRNAHYLPIVTVPGRQCL